MAGALLPLSEKQNAHPPYCARQLLKREGGIDTYLYVNANPLLYGDPLGLLACGDDEDFIQRCLRENYGDSYDRANDLAPFGPAGWAVDEFAEWAEDRGRAQANRDMNSGRYNQGKRIARAASLLKGASAVSGVVGWGAGGYVIGAYLTCKYLCERGSD